MSFADFLRKKDKIEILVSLDEYARMLFEKLKSIRHSKEYHEVLREFAIDSISLNELLAKVQYPRRNELITSVAISSKNSDKFFKELNAIHSWKTDENLNDVFDILSEYRNRLISNHFFEETARNVLLECSTHALFEIKNRIESAIYSINDWNHSPILIEGVFPEEDWVVKEFKITLGHDPSMISFNLSNRKIDNVKKSYSNSKLEYDFKNLTTSLNEKLKEYKTLYVGINDETLFREVQKELALGLPSAIPSIWFLYESPEAVPATKKNIWKVKVLSKYVFPIEQNTFGFISTDDTPVKWVSKLEG